jgi:hypothetical protein
MRNDSTAALPWPARPSQSVRSPMVVPLLGIRFSVSAAAMVSGFYCLKTRIKSLRHRICKLQALQGARSDSCR